MYRFSVSLLALCLLFVFSGCGTTGSSAQASLDDEARALEAADAAFAEMDGGSRQSASGSRQTAAGSSGVQAAPEVSTKTGKEPVWISNPGSAYGGSGYVTGVGHGETRNGAEKAALTALTAQFGQSIRSDLKVTESYSEAMKNGAAAEWSQNSAVENTIRTSVSMDTLIGAEIKEVWYDGKSVYYALAVLEKAKTDRLYRELIRANLEMIANLTAVSGSERNSFNGYARYQFAAGIADANTAFANVLSVIGSSPPGGLKKGADYRLEAADIAKTIPVAVRVTNDRSNRIQSAFASVLTAQGFRSGGNNSRYVLNVDYSTSEASFPNQQYKFVRYELDANLVDTQDNTVLVPYSLEDREGHNNIQEAQQRALTAVEKKVRENYGGALSDYLSRLVPKK